MRKKAIVWTQETWPFKRLDVLFGALLGGPASAVRPTAREKDPKMVAAGKKAWATRRANAEKPPTREEKQNYLKDAHTLAGESSWEWSETEERLDQSFDPTDIKVSAFNDRRLGRVTVYRHGCNGFLALSHDGQDELLFSVPEGKDLPCTVCKKDVPFEILTFTWMKQRMMKL